MVMNSAKAWYWMAVGIVALGLNSEYHQGRMMWLQNAVQRSAAYVQCASSEAVHYVNLAEVLVCHRRAPAGSNPQIMAEMVQARAQLARHHAEMVERRLEATRANKMHAVWAMQDGALAGGARMVAAYDSQDNRAVLGRTGNLVVNVPEVNIPEIDIPEINVPEVNVPGFTVPAVNVPAVKVPAVVVPRIVVPKVTVPAVHVHVPRTVQVPNIDDCNDNGPI